MPAKGGSKRKAARQVARPKKRTRTAAARGKTSRSRVGANVHSYIRKTSISAIVGVNDAAHAPYSSYSQIRFSGLINSAEFAALYDLYRINYVKLQYFLKTDPSAQTAATAFYPRLYWYRDQDDQTPSTQDQMRERSNMKMAVFTPTRPITIWVKPNTLNLVRSSGALNSTKPAYGEWLDMADTSVDHMGIKYNIDNLQNTNYIVEVEATYYFQCKDTR